MRKTLKLIPKHSRLLNENCCCNSEQRCWLETYKATFLIVPYDYSRMQLYILSRGIIKSREGKKESNIVRKRKLWVQVDYVASLCIMQLFLYYLPSSLVLAFRQIKGEKRISFYIKQRWSLMKNEELNMRKLLTWTGSLHIILKEVSNRRIILQTHLKQAKKLRLLYIFRVRTNYICNCNFRNFKIAGKLQHGFVEEWNQKASPPNRNT